MFTTIILLTGEVERIPLADILRRHNPNLKIVSVDSTEKLDNLSAPTLSRARLVGFTTPIVVPARILERLGYGAYNFHPGTPDYPGWQPASFALYDQARTFGATAHLMTRRVDAGDIIDVEMFDVPPDADIVRLSTLAYAATTRLFWRLAPALAGSPEPLTTASIGWGSRKSTKRAFAAMCDIPLTISKDELTQRIRAFGPGDTHSAPTVTLHGFQFRYVWKN